MRRLITLFFAVILVLGLSAQTYQGTMMLSGGSSLNYSNLSLTDYIVNGSELDTEMSTSSLNFSTSAGYFVIDGLAIGLLVEYDATTNEAEGQNNIESTSVTFGPFARFYMGETGLWGQLSYAQGDLKETNSIDQKLSVLAIGAGYAIYLIETISFNPSLAYVMTRSEFDYNGSDIEMRMSGVVFAAAITLHLY